MSAAFAKGDAYYGPLNNPRNIPHIWFIVAGPSVDGKLVAVNITDYRNHEGDLTCVLEIGEHPKISKQSVVRFCDAQECSLDQLVKAERLGILRRVERASDQLIEKLRDGCSKSDDLSPRLAKFVLEN